MLGRDKTSGPKKIFEMLGEILNNTAQWQERNGHGPNQHLADDVAEIELSIPVETRAALDDLELMMPASGARKKLVFIHVI